jgi:radical SAM/Cys-rich protein
MTKLKSKLLVFSQSNLAMPTEQVKQIKSVPGLTFEEQLKAHQQFPLKANAVEILQINLGYKCNLACAHCHIDAGPGRREMMTRQTMQQCLEAIDTLGVHTVDITGGAPEIHDDFIWFTGELGKRDLEIIVRSNLTILVSNEKYTAYMDFMASHKVTIIASLPCYTQANTDNQRGEGVFSASLQALQALNERGYGKSGSGLKLHLVFNPGGPSLPGDQAGLEADYKKVLSGDYGIVFNQLFTITNLPISRFLDSLVRDGQYEKYMQLLIDHFNPYVLDNVMCRNMISVNWQGYLYDCDFNLILDLKTAGRNYHISNFPADKMAGRNIITGNHCYGCTAGAGSSCQGALA